MIYLTRINHLSLVLNSDLIEHIEATPDTVISLTTGQKIIVLETPAEIVDRVIKFRQAVLGKSHHLRFVGLESPARGATELA
jgi:flagellar protein FlbD